MVFHVFGSRDNPAVLCLHGMLARWETEYEASKPLERDFCLIVPGMDGMYPGSGDFTSFADQCRQMEEFITKEFQGHIHGVFGASQGATILSELLARGNIQVDVAVLDGIYLAHQGKLAAWFGYHTYRKVKNNGGKFPKAMDVVMKLMGLGKEDYRMFSLLYWDASDATLKNNMYENYTYRVNPNIRNTRTKIHLWCGEKEPYALKSHKILKEYLSDYEERIFAGMGHGQMKLHHPEEYLALVRKALHP